VDAFGEDSAEVARSLVIIADVLISKGHNEYDAAFELFELAAKHGDQKSTTRAKAFNGMGTIRYHQSKFAEAVDLLEQSVVLADKAETASNDTKSTSNGTTALSELGATFSVQLANVYLQTGQFEKALELYQRCRDRLQAAYTAGEQSEHPVMAQVLSNLGSTNFQMQNYTISQVGSFKRQPAHT
jgi:tetratricopeptide (TPR) repeat protein